MPSKRVEFDNNRSEQIARARATRNDRNREYIETEKTPISYFLIVNTEYGRPYT